MSEFEIQPDLSVRWLGDPSAEDRKKAEAEVAARKKTITAELATPEAKPARKKAEKAVAKPRAERG